MEKETGRNGGGAMTRKAEMEMPVAALLIFAMLVLAIGFIVYQLSVDPRVLAMDECTRGLPNAKHQLECAREIYGDD